MRSDVRKLWIEGPAGRLEAALRLACPARASAVVAHPHPLHGGTLHNPVVVHADRELSRAGFSTLRCNFRGVGSSAGEHDGGRGAGRLHVVHGAAHRFERRAGQAAAFVVEAAEEILRALGA